MELKQVTYFLTVAELGSFSAAADHLYISQSSLSKQIMALEKNWGLNSLIAASATSFSPRLGLLFENMHSGLMTNTKKCLPISRNTSAHRHSPLLPFR
ncbi:MAG: LysR family transcriptional regulator [Anaerolineales bacterium]|nr:LysR family transcriptional regulator [Anaerolineales bacterium]